MTYSAKIKHYIVTYNNNEVLETCLRSIFATDAKQHERSVFVINNHSNIFIPNDLKSKVTVLDNQVRPDFSTGHLSRNWNQAIINGFVSIDKPDADIIICSQNDTEFGADYLEKIIHHHYSYDLVSYGGGDNCISYTPNAIRRVGLWDERFCNIGYQEADYFLRALKYLGDKASINDVEHSRIHNPVDNGAVLKTITGAGRGCEHNRASTHHHKQSDLMFKAKWGIQSHTWDDNTVYAKEKILSFVLYPYFEFAIETLEEQRFLFAKTDTISFNG